MGPDELSAKLLFEVQNEIAYPLLLLFKKSLSESSIPQDWKQANVIVIWDFIHIDVITEPLSRWMAYIHSCSL